MVVLTYDLLNPYNVRRLECIFGQTSSFCWSNSCYRWSVPFFIFQVIYWFLFWVDLDENSSVPVCESLHTWAACIYDLYQFASWSCDFYCCYSSILIKKLFLVLPSSTQQITTLTMSIHQQCLPVRAWFSFAVTRPTRCRLLTSIQLVNS